MSLSNILNDDVIMCILEYLNDIDKMNFLSVDLRLHSFVNHIWFNGIYDYKLIRELPYLDRFKHIKYETNIINIPKCITHLIFGLFFNQSIKGCIPNSVTHLTFGDNFNQNIENCIPNSVTHLTFGWYFNQNIKDCIPNNVSHLKFGWKFNQDIKDCIPNSVTHLKFGYSFNQNKDCIPDSVTHLTLNKQFYKRNKKYINKNIQINIK
ncbi:F-box and FNIP repeat-containing [Acanthamoeba polyphaga mimivirus]|uniref:F-box and FNIP repeat-containing n=1 Tax=Acanthamoeba polyphaga mimivirus TaxID=212035 RepID=A0A2L2DII1_MIMIV|nr:F-box and FNIP repeat-containing [Acanthamoeba polyphaga mimivirus]